MCARKRLLRQIDGEDLCAFLSKQLRGGTADAGRRTGDDGNAILEAHFVKSRCFPEKPSRDLLFRAMAGTGQGPTARVFPS